MNWPDGLPRGKEYDRPVISLDITAASLALAGEEVPEELDGVNVIPYLNGEIEGESHEALYWRFWHQKAIGIGDWKWIMPRRCGNVMNFISILSNSRQSEFEIQYKIFDVLG